MRLPCSASGDSVTFPFQSRGGCAKKALRLDTAIKDIIPYYMLMLDRVRQNANESISSIFTLIIFISQHSEAWPQKPSRRYTAVRICRTTGHYIVASTISLLFPSRTIRDVLFLQANFAATVHHGLPKSLLRPTFEPQGGYLAFLGRIAPEKRPDRAYCDWRVMAQGSPSKSLPKWTRWTKGLFQGIYRLLC